MSRLDKPTPGEGQAISTGDRLPFSTHEPQFSFQWRGRVIRVIDGDSLELYLHVALHVYQVAHVRVLGVNTPEMVGRSRGAGLEAKRFTEEWVRIGEARWLADNYPFYLTSSETDAFGRYLVNIWHRNGAAVLEGKSGFGGPYGPSLAEELIRAGHGVPA